MGIFPFLNHEKVIQVRDTIRLDASRSFVSKDMDQIINVEIEPESGDGFKSVFSSKRDEWFLDWQFEGQSREVDVTVRLTIDDDALNPTQQTQTFKVYVLSFEDDGLFSDDSELFSYEEEIFKLLPRGKSSFIYKHRRAQNIIVESFNERGVLANNQTRITKEHLLDVDDVKQWSICLTLALIFEDNSKTVGDVFFRKSESYYSMALGHKHRAFFRIDFNGDGQLSNSEINPYYTARIVRS